MFKKLSEEGSENGRNVQYGHLDKADPDPQPTLFVTINGAKFARLSDHEANRPSRRRGSLAIGDDAHHFVKNVRSNPNFPT